MRAHAEDLRVEVRDRTEGEHLVAAVTSGDRSGPFSPRERALLEFAVKLTLRQSEMRPEDAEALRAHGLDDAAIHDAAQVTALFNYYTRLADGLGVDPEPEWS
jgi:uncharacterized peroxidase-related enzyme